MDRSLLEAAADLLRKAKTVAVLTGAGISAESGVPTFRGKDGLWKRFRAEDLATPEAFARDPKLVWEWYRWRRGLMRDVAPNPGHSTLARWETRFDRLDIITQNIDGLHAKAGSKNIIELHGNIWKTRCTQEGTVFEPGAAQAEESLPRCPNCGALLRPHVVWFGEMLDRKVLEKAFTLSAACRVMLVVGTSAYVQPAASLPLTAVQAGAGLIEINPEPTPLTEMSHLFLRGKSGEILPALEAAI
jgi:NAD-dependent deacetylase